VMVAIVGRDSDGECESGRDCCHCGVGLVVEFGTSRDMGEQLAAQWQSCCVTYYSQHH
jgi:hypothetical protein